MEKLITAGIRVLEGMFVVGVLGSALVLVLTTVEDVRELLHDDETLHLPE